MSPAHRRPTTRTITLLAALVVLVGTVGAWGAGSADATSFRYWSYWTGSEGGWSFSTQGAARRPADGTVEGWRFAISEASSSTTPPRREPSFARLCGGTPPEADTKRIGLVVDFGTTGDAPDGETPPALLAGCVVVPEDANGYDVLVSSVTLRTKDGLICGMNGYPATECGAPVADPTPAPSGSGGSGGGSGAGGADGSAAGTSGQGGGADASSTDPQTEGGDAKKKKERDRKKNDDEKVTPSPDPTVDSATPAAAAVVAGTTPTAGAGGPGAGVVLGVGLIAVLAAAAFVVQRRRR